jgi:hypothetical protein
LRWDLPGAGFSMGPLWDKPPVLLQRVDTAYLGLLHVRLSLEIDANGDVIQASVVGEPKGEGKTLGIASMAGSWAMLVNTSSGRR